MFLSSSLAAHERRNARDNDGMTESHINTRANNTDAGNGSYGISRVIDASARRRLIRGVGAKESYEPETDYVDHDDRDRYGICNIPYQLPPVGTY